MKKSEKFEFINNIRANICVCYAELIKMKTSPKYEDFCKSRCNLNLDDMKKELAFINDHLDINRTPDYKLNVYSLQTMEMLEAVLSSEVKFFDAFDL